MRSKQPPSGKTILPLTAAIILTLIFPCASALALPSPNPGNATAAPTADPGTIDAFNTTITFNDTGAAEVTEEIIVDFTKEAHHGIFRNIPLTFTNQNNKTVTFITKVVSVTDQNDRPWKYQETKDPDYIGLKIGDPEKLIRDIVTYKINYLVYNPLIKTADGAELYWNVTGSQWEMPIKTSRVKINPPSIIKEDQLLLDCFIGKEGSDEKLCRLRLENDNTIQGQISRSLAEDEGFTIKVHFPPEYFNLPETEQTTQSIDGGSQPGSDFKIFTFIWQFLLNL